jgi:hypothetical protein
MRCAPRTTSASASSDLPRPSVKSPMAILADPFVVGGFDRLPEMLVRRRPSSKGLFRQSNLAQCPRCFVDPVRQLKTLERGEVVARSAESDAFAHERFVIRCLGPAHETGEVEPKRGLHTELNREHQPANANAPRHIRPECIRCKFQGLSAAPVDSLSYQDGRKMKPGLFTNGIGRPTQHPRTKRSARIF